MRGYFIVLSLVELVIGACLFPSIFLIMVFPYNLNVSFLFENLLFFDDLIME